MVGVNKNDLFPEDGNLRQRHAWFKRRLVGRSQEDCTLLASRAALRVLSQLRTVFSQKKGKNTGGKSGARLVLPLLRCQSLSLAASLAPASEREAVSASAADSAAAASAADSAAAAAAADSDSAYSAAAAHSAAYSVYAAADSAPYSVYSAADSAADSAVYSAASVADSASAADSAAAAFSADLARLDGSEDARVALAISPLWPEGVPATLHRTWSRFSVELRSADGGWEIWADWYDSLRHGEKDGRFLFNLPTPRALKLLHDVALIDNALWDGDPATLNAEFRRLVEEARPLKAPPSESKLSPAPPPVEPLPSSAPELELSDGQLHLQKENSSGIGEADSDDLSFLHERLRDKLPQLKTFVAPLANSYPGLKAVVDEYSALIGRPLEELDTRQFWAAGVGLVSHALAFEAHDIRVSDKPPLEPDCLAVLSEISRLHGSLILELPKGSKWTKSADETRLPPRATLEPPTLEFLQRLLAGRMLDTKLRKFIQSVRDSVLESGWETARQGYLAYGVVRNAVIAIGRPLAKALGTAGTWIGGGIVAHVASANGWDTNTALTVVSFVRDNSALILQYAAPFPELRQWATFVIDHLDLDRGKKT